MFGKLTWSAFNHEISQNLAVFMMVLTGIFLVGLVTYLKKWKYLWKEWLTSLDPKRIGVMYIIMVLLMFFKGVSDALMIRVQQVLSVGDMPWLHLIRALPRGLFRPWHDDDFLRRHGDRIRPHEFSRPAADRGARCRLSLF